jgi:hypothetical protein
VPLYDVCVLGSRDVSVTVRVEADSEDEAEEKALEEVEKKQDTLNWEAGDLDDGFDVDEVEQVE